MSTIGPTTTDKMSDIVSIRSRLVDLEDKVRSMEQMLQKIDDRTTENTSVDVMVAYCEQ